MWEAATGERAYGIRDGLMVSRNPLSEAPDHHPSREMSPFNSATRDSVRARALLSEITGTLTGGGGGGTEPRSIQTSFMRPRCTRNACITRVLFASLCVYVKDRIICRKLTIPAYARRLSRANSFARGGRNELNIPNISGK